MPVELTVERTTISLRGASLDPYAEGFAAITGTASPDLSEGRSQQTWVMACTPHALNAVDEPPASIAEFGTFLFERCLRAINRVVRASILVTRNPTLYVLTKDSLDPYVERAYVQGLRPDNFEWSKFNLNVRQRNPVFADIPSDTTGRMKSALRLLDAESRSGHTHPLRLGRELALLAQSMQHTGHVTASVALLQTSVETFLQGLHRMIELDEGNISAGVPQTFESLLSKRLPPSLGGDWSSARSAVTRYRADLYSVRNRAVHGGRDVQWDEVGPAFAARAALVDFVEQRVLAKWRNLPRTACAVCDPDAGGSRPASKSAHPHLQRLATTLYWA